MTDMLPAPTVTTSSVLELVPDADRLVSRIATTSFVPKAYRNRPDELLAAILTGHELGLPPMTAMSKVHNIEGTASLSAEAMRALVLSKGHDLWIEEANDHKVIVGGRRAGSDKASHVTWTIDMAKQAGLTGKQNWRKHPQQMLLARATAQLCRMIFPDCLAGISHAYEEVVDGDLADDGDEVVTAGVRPEGVEKPKPAKRTRKAPAKKAEPVAAARPVVGQIAGDPMAEFEQLDEMAAGKDERPVEERRAQMLAIRTREVLGDIDRDDRLALYAESTRRIVKSGKELSSEDVDKVLVDLARIEAGDLELRGRRLVEVVAEAELVDDAPAVAEAAPAGGVEEFGSEASWSVEMWRELLADRGVRLASVIREAQKLARELERDEVPTSLDGLASCGDQELCSLVRAFVEGEAG